MTYTVHMSNNANRADIVTALASFDNRADAVAFVETTYDVIYADDDDGDYAACVRFKGKKFSIPFIVGITAR